MCEYGGKGAGRRRRGVRREQLLWGVGEELTGDTRRTAKHRLFSPGLTAAVSQGTRWNNEVSSSTTEATLEQSRSI